MVLQKCGVEVQERSGRLAFESLDGDDVGVALGEVSERSVDREEEFVAGGADDASFTNCKPRHAIKRANKGALVEAVPVTLVAVHVHGGLGAQTGQAGRFRRSRTGLAGDRLSPRDHGWWHPAGATKDRVFVVTECGVVVPRVA